MVGATGEEVKERQRMENRPSYPLAGWIRRPLMRLTSKASSILNSRAW